MTPGKFMNKFVVLAQLPYKRVLGLMVRWLSELMSK